jgi:hypothetical protein
MLKIARVAAMAVLTLALAGCGGEAKTASTQRLAEISSDAPAGETQAPTATEPVDPAEGITAPGEVCDPASMYTIECSVKHPDVGFLNGVTRVGQEPLASLAEEEKIALGHAACEQLQAGVAAADINLGGDSAPTDKPAGWNNGVIVNAAPLSYCHAFADPDLIAPFLAQG